MASEIEKKNMELMQATHGAHDHRAESVQLFKTFPDNKVHNRPYKENLFYDVVGMMKQLGIG